MDMPLPLQLQPAAQGQYLRNSTPPPVRPPPHLRKPRTHCTADLPAPSRYPHAPGTQSAVPVKVPTRYGTYLTPVPAASARLRLLGGRLGLLYLYISVLSCPRSLLCCRCHYIAAHVCHRRRYTGDIQRGGRWRPLCLVSLLSPPPPPLPRWWNIGIPRLS